MLCNSHINWPNALAISLPSKSSTAADALRKRLAQCGYTMARLLRCRSKPQRVVTPSLDPLPFFRVYVGLCILEVAIQEIPQLVQQMCFDMCRQRIYTPSQQDGLFSASMRILLPHVRLQDGALTFGMGRQHIDEVRNAQHRLRLCLSGRVLLKVGFPATLVEHAPEEDEQTLPLARRHQALMERIVKLVGARRRACRVELAFLHRVYFHECDSAQVPSARQSISTRPEMEGEEKERWARWCPVSVPDRADAKAEFGSRNCGAAFFHGFIVQI